MVARPLGKADLRGFSDDKLKKARDARLKEWTNLRSKFVWLDADVEEWSDVVARTRKAGRTVHLGYLHGLMVEKNSELPDGDENKKLKYRVVFLGDRVRTQNWEQAMFQDQGSAPATMEAAKFADMYGLFPGHDVEQADAEQAYVQAELKGPPTYVVLPEDGLPTDPELLAKFKSMRQPVVRLRKALYGHPDSGTFWEEHCDAKVRSCGFIPVSESWPSCYYHPKLKLMLTIYVDDFLMSGPKIHLRAGWDMLRSNVGSPGLKIEDQKPVGADHESVPGKRDGKTLYLGCYRSVELKCDPTARKYESCGTI